MNKQNAQQRIINIIQSLADEKRDQLEVLKQRYPHEWERPDFIWHSLVSAFSTMGGSAGSKGLIENKENYNSITFEALSKIDHAKRVAQVQETMYNANVRWPNRKASYLVQNFEKIVKMGGLISARDQLENSSGKEGKIRFLKSFAGISDKYARDIMMDVYHPEFRDSIAVDIRIQKISDELGLQFENYADHEFFYVDSAHRAGLNGWEIDRLLYNYNTEVISLLRSDKTQSTFKTDILNEKLKHRIVILESKVADLQNQLDQLSELIEKQV